MDDANLSPLLAVRAEASAAIGTGHVMRMLALAQAWQDAGGRVVFFLERRMSPSRARLKAEQCGIEVLGEQTGSPADAAAVVLRSAKLKPDWLAVDGYAFDRSYFEGLAPASVPILAMVDYRAGGTLPVTGSQPKRGGPPGRIHGDGALGASLLGLPFILLHSEFNP